MNINTDTNAVVTNFINTMELLSAIPKDWEILLKNKEQDEAQHMHDTPDLFNKMKVIYCNIKTKENDLDLKAKPLSLVIQSEVTQEGGKTMEFHLITPVTII